MSCVVTVKIESQQQQKKKTNHSQREYQDEEEENILPELYESDEEADKLRDR